MRRKPSPGNLPARPSIVLIVLALVLAALAPAVAVAAPIVPDRAPVVTGIPREGATLTADPGAWPGTAPTYKFQWQRCDTAGAACAAIGGQTRATYAAVAADVGRTLRVEVTATTSTGIGQATSDATTKVDGTPPSSSQPPVVSGYPREAQTLTTTAGTWTGTQPVTTSLQWLRCTPDEALCAAVDGATTASYRVGPDDSGSRLKVRAAASNVVGDRETYSAATAVIGPADPPAAVGTPPLTGTPRESQLLTVAPGTWDGATPMTYAYRWLRCNAVTDACTTLSTTATATTYKLLPADVGSRIRVEVTATNPDGTATLSTAPSAIVAPDPPVSVAPAPAQSGAPRSGQLLTGTAGKWTGTPAITYAYAWYRCRSACDPIPGADGLTYRLTDAEIGTTVLMRVTATNAAGEAFRETPATATITPAAPPVNGTRPGVTGTLRDGQILTGTDGSWTGVTPLSYARAWLRCEEDGSGCAAITGATGTTYKLTAADVGKAIRLRVTATNPDGVVSATSDPAGPVAAIPPTAGTPAVTGVVRDGELLTAAPGTWGGSASIVYTYAWSRCRAGTCDAVDGATNATYQLTPDDIGATLKVRVTGTNRDGTASADSAPTAPVAGLPPVPSTAPGVRGLARDGQVMTADRGEWGGTPTVTYALQWQRCSGTGTACVSIAGATGATYTLQSADYNLTVRVHVEASNAWGTRSADSPASAKVAPAAPAVVTPPTIAGVRSDGATLSAGTGVWTGTTPIAFALQWQRFDAVLDAWTAIPGATGVNYVLTSADVNKPIRLRVTATNPSAIPGVAYSGSVYDVAPTAPVSVARPTVTGTVRDGQLLTAAPGTWEGTVPQTRTYAWLRCDAQGNGCSYIGGEEASTYRLTPSDVGGSVRVRVTSINDAGTPVAAESDRSSVVLAEAPANRAAPVVTGSLQDGEILSADPGDWSGTPAISFSYRWQRCSVSTTARCTPIDGATGRTYALRTADVGGGVRVEVTAMNGGGSKAVLTAITGVVLPSPPVNVDLPAIEGVARDGNDLSVRPGTWSGVVSFAYDYRWYHCDTSGGDCGIIAGATASTYRLTSADIGYRLRAEVIARNAGGSGSAFSPVTGVGEPRPPSSLALPRVTGHTGIGEELTSDDGGWTGSEPMRYTRQWLRCDADGAACVPIGDAIARAYRLTADDLGHRLRIRVRAVNDAPGDGVYADSDPTRVVRDDPPVNAGLPGVESAAGPFADGVRLRATDGKWTGAEILSSTYQWQRCSPAGDVCAPIVGATEQTYVPGPVDLGLRLRVTVTVDNGVGAATATSPPTSAIKPAPPSAFVDPVVTAGKGLQPGGELNGNNGAWRGASPISYTYSWLRCDADGGACAPISGAGASKYVLTDADVGRTLRIRVTATNPTQAVSAESQPTQLVSPLKPVLTGKVTVSLDGESGTKARVALPVRGDGGVWAGTGPIRYAYRWQRCMPTSDCIDIPGEVGPAYVPADADVGRRVRFVVTAENTGGVTTAASPLTDTIAGVAPGPAARPSVVVSVGTRPRDGLDLMADPGTWTGTGPLTYSYQWKRCNADLAGCKTIPRATAQKYTASADDVGQRLSVIVTAKSAAGKADAESPATAEVDAIPPGVTERPSVTRPPGALQPGSTMTSMAGIWTGTKPITLTYQWLRCLKTGKQCRVIDKATKETYRLEPGDFSAEGKLSVGLRIAVTGVNSAGTVTSTSLPFGRTKAGDTRGGSTTPGAGAPTGTTLSGASAKLDGRGRLRVALKCPKGSAPCTGSLNVTGSSLSKALKVSLKPGKSRRWTVKLDPSQRAAAVKAKVLRATLTFGGRSRAVAVRWPKRLKR